MKQQFETLISLLTWTANISDTSSNSILFNIKQISSSDDGSKELSDILNSNQLTPKQHELVSAYKEIVEQDSKLLSQIVSLSKELSALREIKKYIIAKELINELKK